MMGSTSIRTIMPTVYPRHHGAGKGRAGVLGSPRSSRRVRMKAAAIRSHGGPEVVELLDLPEPVARAGEAVVAVKAAALNHLDLWVRKGWPGLKLAFPHVLGSDVAGVVEAVGAGVDGVKAGDEV